MKRKYFVSTILIATLFLFGCDKLKSRDQLNKGVRAYTSAKYQEAVEHFKTAIDLDPTNPNAKLYLATAYMIQYIPGAESPENIQMAQAAHDQFLQVLEQDPKKSVAMASIALLYFNQKKMDEARDWYQKLIQVDANNKEAYYTLGVIAWTRTYQDRMEARAKLGMKPEDPGPLKEKKVREELKTKNLETINQGIQFLEKALSIDSEYDDAMAYLNLLHRERADLADSQDQYKKDIDVADNWVQKTLETKKIKAARMPGATGITTEESTQ